MYPISAEVAELFANQRQVVRLTFDSVADSIVLTEADIKSGGFVIDRACVSGDIIELGSVIASELGVQLDNTSGQLNSVTFEGAECFVEVGTKEWSDDQAQVQYIPMGYFTVDGSPRKLDTISFTALDRMVKFDKAVDFTQLTFPMTVSALLSSICAICGVTLSTDYQSSWVNKTHSISAVPEGDNLTYRQLLSWICEIMGVCAYINAAGSLTLHWYGQAQSSTPSITAGVRYNSDIQENAITLTGVRVVKDDTVYLAGTDSYALTIEGNALLQSGYQTVANNIYNARGGLTYTPFTATVKSMPYIYPLDTINFVKGESTIPSIITNMNFALNNSTVLEGKGKSQIENNYAELNPMTTQQTVVLNRLHSKTVQEFKAADGELLSTIANSESKYDESTSPGTITLRGYGAPADAGYPAADHNGAYYLDEMTGFVYLSDGTSWSKVAELNLITTQLDTKIDQTAEGMLFSASQMIGGERTKNLIPFVYNANGTSARSSYGVKIERNGTGFDLTRTASSSSNAAFTVYTQDCSARYDNDKLANVKTLPTGRYIVSGTGFNNDIQYRIQYSTNGSSSSKIVYFGEQNDTSEKTFEITDAMTFVRHYIWVRSGTDLGSGVTVKPMIRDASIADDTYTEGIDTGAYMCSAINITPEKLELDAGKLIINSGNFQLDENGVLTSTAGTFKTSNYTPASGSTKTVGGQIDLSAAGSDLLIDTANFKVSGGGAVTAEDATFHDCTIEGGEFLLSTVDEKDVAHIRLTNLENIEFNRKVISYNNFSANRMYMDEVTYESDQTVRNHFVTILDTGEMWLRNELTHNEVHIRSLDITTPVLTATFYMEVITNQSSSSVDKDMNGLLYSNAARTDSGWLLAVTTDNNNNHELVVGNEDFPLLLQGTNIKANGKKIISDIKTSPATTLPVTLLGAYEGNAVDWTISGNAEGVGKRTKNIADLNGVDATYYGIRYCEENGFLRAVGKYNDNAAHTQPRFYYQLDAGSYAVSGSPDYADTNIRIQIGTCDDAQGTNYATLGYDEGSGFSFTLENASWIVIRIYTARALYNQDIDLTIPLMLRKADTTPEFIPYGYQVPITISQTGQTTKNYDIFVGNAPLTNGQSVSSMSTGQDIRLFEGENVISTTLSNKPKMTIKYFTT